MPYTIQIKYKTQSVSDKSTDQFIQIDKTKIFSSKKETSFRPDLKNALVTKFIGDKKPKRIYLVKFIKLFPKFNLGFELPTQEYITNVFFLKEEALIFIKQQKTVYTENHEIIYYNILEHSVKLNGSTTLIDTYYHG